MSSNNGFAGRLQRPEMSHNSVPLFQHADDITPAESQGVTPRTSRLENPFATPEDSASSQGDIRSSVMESGAAAVTTMPVDPRYDAEEELKRAGKTRVARQKIIFVLVLLCLNGALIFGTWWWTKYWYVFLPLITLTVALNTIMIFSVILFRLKRLCLPEKKIKPENPENIVYVVPCYNETPEELTRSLDSLVNQKGIEQHRKSIIIVCDGRVRGPGMSKTTAESLFEDILIVRTSRRRVASAYYGWTHEMLNVMTQTGTYKGIPYFCIVKLQNQGKRDSLVCVRSFLYNFNIRHQRPSARFSPEFFGEMTAFLQYDSQMEMVDVLVGMDADTVFDDSCVSELLKESRYPGTVGVCGYVAVDFQSRPFGLWSLYQSTEYTISQALRRLHQSTVTKKVSCLPGCCQLLKICEETCGNRILYDLFGYCPKPTDGMLKHIRATASEDRNHVCLMLSTYPKAQTRQALRANAYTIVPQTWSVFLSQRRRWTLGATSNDLFLAFAPGVQWFERILAISNCLVWFVNIFVLASIANLIYSALRVEWWVILAFSSVMIIPVIYYICVVFWLPRGMLAKTQYLVGLVMYVVCGPFLNLIVLGYALWNMDSFGWGKTRRVLSEDSDNEKLFQYGPTEVPHAEAPAPTWHRSSRQSSRQSPRGSIKHG